MDLDAAARTGGMRAMQHNESKHCLSIYHHNYHIALLALFDFAAAFPSILHGWIMLVLEARRFPRGFINFISCLYWMNSAVTFCNGKMQLLFWYLSGVLQGCPASAFIFDLCLDPFLAAFDDVIPSSGRGILRACADDLGAALNSHKSLMHMYAIFETAQLVAGLTLKPSKCNLVPTSLPFSNDVKKFLTEWLGKHIPNWVKFQIVPCAKYLGFMLGPTAGEAQWKSVFRKFSQRVNMISNTHSPTSTSIHLYNTHCVSLLGYVAQLVPLPQSFEAIERKAIHKMLHLATNSMTVNEFMHLDKFNLLPIKSCKVSCLSAQIRCAQSTLPFFEEWLPSIHSLSMQVLPISQIATGASSPAFWDSVPFAVNLKSARSGFPELTNVNKGFSEAMQEVSSAHRNKTKPKLQKILYKHLLPSIYPLSTSHLIAKRARDLAPAQADDVDLQQIEAACSLLRKLPHYACSHIVKTWVNSWATSDRFHEEVRHKCFFGCPHAKDQLLHYLSCPALWAALELLPLSPSPLPSSPLERLGVLHPCLKNLCVISCCFHAYHFTKSHYRIGMSDLVCLSNFCTAFNAAWPKVARFAS